jgi:hypothetical protein
LFVLFVLYRVLPAPQLVADECARRDQEGDRHEQGRCQRGQVSQHQHLLPWSRPRAFGHTWRRIRAELAVAPSAGRAGQHRQNPSQCTLLPPMQSRGDNARQTPGR